MIEATSDYPPSAVPPSLRELKSRLVPFRQSHGVARLEVFGSVARGEAHPGSDIDLLITYRPKYD